MTWMWKLPLVGLPTADLYFTGVVLRGVAIGVWTRGPRLAPFNVKPSAPEARER